MPRTHVLLNTICIPVNPSPEGEGFTDPLSGTLNASCMPVDESGRVGPVIIFGFRQLLEVYWLPNTFLSSSVDRAAGFSRIFFSSVATIRNNPSRVFSVT